MPRLTFLCELGCQVALTYPNRPFIIPITTTTIAIMRPQKIAISDISLAYASASRDSSPLSSAIATPPAEVVPTKRAPGDFPGDHVPIGGSALKFSEFPGRILYVATAMPVRSDEKMTSRMLLEGTLFSSVKEKCRKTDG